MTPGACTPPSGGERPIADLLGWADCRADALGWAGYQAIGQGNWFATILTATLTIAVAIQGYRLLAGRTPDLGHVLGQVVRLALAITLAGSVGAYGTLVYRVATEGPFELSGRLTEAAGIAGGDLPARLDRLYTVIRLDPETRGRLARGGPPRAAMPAQATGDSGQRSAATLFVVATVGPWIALRMALALLLAIGPFAALMLLFQATTGVFVNWLRAVAGLGLALAGLAIVLPLQLEALEPIAASAGTGTPDYTAMIAVIGVFALVSIAILCAAHRVTALVMLPARHWVRQHLSAPPFAGEQAPSWSPAGGVAAFAGTVTLPAAPPPPQRSHAASVADALSQAARRSDPARVTTIEHDRGAPRSAVLSRHPTTMAHAAPIAPDAARRGLPNLRPSDRITR